MSFSEEVKHELIRKNSDNKKFQVAELAALLRMNGTIQIQDNSLAVKIKMFYGDLARKIYSLLKNEYNFGVDIIVRKRMHFDREQIYELRLHPQEGLEEFLQNLGFISKDNQFIFKIKESFIKDEESRKGYLRGAFLGGGSVNSPRSEYHLEFRCEYRRQAEDLLRILVYFDLEGRITEHQEKQVVYFKSYNDVVKILNLLGAHQALLEMEGVQILKEVKNNVNRRVNCETANLDKTVNAALSQLEDITLIEEEHGLDQLSSSLKEIAKLRKKNPYASLKELGEMLDPSLSKSGVNHRIRRIKKIARQIRGEE